MQAAKTKSTSKTKSLILDVCFPVLIFISVVLFFKYSKHIPLIEVTDNKKGITFILKFIATILFPYVLINLFKQKEIFGINFPSFKESFRLSIKSYAIAGPACISFILIGLLGLKFTDWGGSIILSITFSLATILIAKSTSKLPTRESTEKKSNGIVALILLGIITATLPFFMSNPNSLVVNISYYIFIVALGEELFFRGFLQSSFNKYFRKTIKIKGVNIGLGLLLSSILFGLMHAIVKSPPVWPHAIFTFVVGLLLGFLREKDGSILAPIILHSLIDLPMAFMK